MADFVLPSSHVRPSVLFQKDPCPNPLASLLFTNANKSLSSAVSAAASAASSSSSPPASDSSSPPKWPEEVGDEGEEEGEEGRAKVNKHTRQRERKIKWRRLEMMQERRKKGGVHFTTSGLLDRSDRQTDTSRDIHTFQRIKIQD